MEILVSIVVPTFNRSIDLKRAVNSVIGQTYNNWELIVVDNHSEDDTDQMINSFNNPRIKLFKIHNNGVIAKSRNYGISQSKGEFVAFLDSDDWWMKNKLEISVKTLYKGLDVIYHDLYIIKKVNQKIFFRKTPSKDLSTPVFHDLISRGCVLTTSSVVIKKSVLTEMGGLPEDTEMGTWCDYFGWLFVAKITDKFEKVPGIYGYYWNGGGNYTTPERTLKAIKYFKRFYSSELKRIDPDSLKWINYLTGRLYFGLREYEESIKYLNCVGFDSLSIVTWIKAKFFLTLIKLKFK